MKRWSVRAVILFGVAFLFLPAPLGARELYPSFGPLTAYNHNPILLTNLQLQPERAVALAPGEFQTMISSGYSNLFERGTNGGNVLDLDMELLRLAFDLRYGWRDGFEFGVEIPFLRFDGGFLDAFVDSYHRTFGFPRGGRERVANNRFAYRFESNGQTLLDYPARSFGVGDVTFRIKHHFLEEDRFRPAVAWLFDFKAPTGDRDQGLGSGNPDMGLGLAFEKSCRRFHGYVDLAALTIGGTNAIANFMESEQFVYVVAGEWTLLDDLSVVAQLDGGTPLLKGTGINPWDGVPLDLVIGFKGEESGMMGGNDFVWQVAFAEDVTSKGPSVDFTAIASVGVRFQTLGQRYRGDWFAQQKTSRHH